MVFIRTLGSEQACWHFHYWLVDKVSKSCHIVSLTVEGNNDKPLVIQIWRCASDFDRIHKHSFPQDSFRDGDLVSFATKSDWLGHGLVQCAKNRGGTVGTVRATNSFHSILDVAICCPHLHGVNRWKLLFTPSVICTTVHHDVQLCSGGVDEAAEWVARKAWKYQNCTPRNLRR